MASSRPRRRHATSQKESDMASTSKGATSRSEAVVFWTWIGVLGVGLAYMITIPLLGR